MMIRFTYCKNFATAVTLERDWNTVATGLNTFEAFPSKEASIKRAAFVGGVRADETKGRADGNIAVRTVATLDFDAPTGMLDEIEFQLDLVMPCAFVAYSTFRHTPEVPRFRLCVPLSRPVNEIEHRMVVNDIERLVDLGKVDNCSFVMSQLMFLPSHKEGVTPWSMRHDGAAWEVGGTEIAISVLSGAGEVSGDQDDLADFAAAVVSEPLDMGASEVDALLENYPAEGKEYDEWVRVGMALYHQFRGSPDGYSRWLEWSRKSPKHEARQMKMKWRSFGGAAKPVTMASIIKLAGGRRTAVEITPTGSTYAALEAEAANARTLEAYTTLRNRVGSLSDMQLRGDMRMMIASTVYDAFGKGAGLTKAAINKAFAPAKKDKGDGFFGNAETPEWARDYVYCAGEYTFERVSTRHSLKPDAFRLCYAGEIEVLASEMDAVSYLTKNKLIETVDSKMFWPGFAQIFVDTNTGLKHLNTYEREGVEPCAELDDEGQAVVGRFLRHLDLTVAVERERRIILDFMAFVYQNPGQRVKWALLIKGIEGNGKTYFFNVMEYLLGRQASVTDTTSIESGFNAYASGSVLVCIEEIRIQGAKKYEILDKMKPLLTNERVALTAKNKDGRTVPNFTSYMLMTNHADAIPVGDNDRRYCVISCRQTRKEDLFAQHGGKEGVEDYFRQLFELDLKRRPDALARFLTDYKISADFNPSGRAPETEGLEDMRSMNVSEDKENLVNAIEKYARDGIVSADILDVTYLNRMAVMDGLEIPVKRTLSHILSDMGLVRIDGGKVKINAVEDNHVVWYRRGALLPSGEVMTSDLAKKLVKDAFNFDGDFKDEPF